MPALKRLPEKFSIQGCEASEGVLVPRKRHKARANDAFGTELFSRRPASGAGVARPDVGREAGRLSLGHNDTAPDLSAENNTFSPPVSKPKLAVVYPGAALGELPGIQNRGDCSSPQTRPKSKRGKVLSFSESSRRKLQCELAKIRTDAELWMTCLSLPGFTEHFTHDLVKLAFLRFLKQLVAKCARDPDFLNVAGFWKQELQKRNALHFHLIFSGITDSNRVRVWHWCVEHWIQCVMDIPGIPPEIMASEVSKMRGVHLFEGSKRKGFRDSNFQKIRGNFHSYFSKYLGKDVEAQCAESPIPGRWWGKFNAKRLPLAPRRELVIPDRVAVHAQRVARKIRQSRADNAKHSALCRRFGGMASDGLTPGVSRQQLQRFYREWVKLGGESALEHDLPGVIARLRLAGGSGMGAAITMFCKAVDEGFNVKGFLTGYKFPAAMKFSSVRLTGSHVPEMIVRILHYAGERALDASLLPPVLPSRIPFFHPGSLPF